MMAHGGGAPDQILEAPITNLLNGKVQRRLKLLLNPYGIVENIVELSLLIMLRLDQEFKESISVAFQGMKSLQDPKKQRTQSLILTLLQELKAKLVRCRLKM